MEEFNNYFSRKANKINEKTEASNVPLRKDVSLFSDPTWEYEIFGIISSIKASSELIIKPIHVYGSTNKLDSCRLIALSIGQ